MEVMVSLIVFSILMGMSSRLVEKGFEVPYFSTNSPEWLELIDKTSIIVTELPPDYDPLLLKADSQAFVSLKKPSDFKTWNISWGTTNLENASVCEFSAQTIYGKTVEWKIFKSQ